MFRATLVNGAGKLPEVAQVGGTFHKLIALPATRYLLVSVVALGCDLTCYLLLLQTGSSPVMSAAISYSVGIAVHWLLSSRLVFTGRVAVAGALRVRQKALFVLSSFCGLALTTAIVSAADIAGVDARLAKLFAVGASFFTTWLLRSRIVFR